MELKKSKSTPVNNYEILSAVLFIILLCVSTGLLTLVWLQNETTQEGKEFFIICGKSSVTYVPLIICHV